MSSGASVKADLASSIEAISPLTLARDQVLPLCDAMATVMPGGVLRRGTSVVVDGSASVSLALGLAAEATAQGSWVVFVGVEGLCLSAAEEFGLELGRVALVDDPGDKWANVVSALAGAVDIVVTKSPNSFRASDGRRLSARLRERGGVIIEIGGGGRQVMQADVRLSAARQSWSGLGFGYGLLSSRLVTVEVGGRGAASRPRSVDVLLPGESGRPEAVSFAQRSQPMRTYDTIADVADLTARLASRSVGHHSAT